VANVDIDSEGFGWIPEDDFLGHFAADIDPVKAKVMYAVQQPLHTSTFEDVMGAPAWKSLPSWYLVAENDGLHFELEEVIDAGDGETVLSVQRVQGRTRHMSHAGRPPRNKGRRYPADPPRVEEIVAVMRAAGGRPHGDRVRGLIVVLWRAGLRISETLALNEADLELGRGSLLIRRGKGGRRREVGMDEWGWAQLRPWLEYRLTLPLGRSSA
jgi:integrase